MNSSPSSPSVAVIILSWNGREDTLACLESLGALTCPLDEIIVVDNGSSDGTAAAVREAFPDVTLLETGANLGFAGGNNVGIRHALTHGADYVWLLNNDTLVEPECLGEMVRAAEADARIGMVGSRICYLHDPATVWYAGGTVDLSRAEAGHVGKDCPDGPAYDAASETGYVTGCSLLARKEMLEDVGLLDETYFLYFEDADWSLRARQKGWMLLYEPKARLLHREGAQRGGRYTERFIYYMIRNRLYFMHRFAPHWMSRCHLLQLCLVLYFVKSALTEGVGPALAALRWSFRGYADYYGGHMGRREGL